MAGPPPFKQSKYANWQEEAAAMEAALRGHEQRVRTQLLSPDDPTEQYAYIGSDGKVAMVSPDGQHVFVPQAEAQSYANNGWMPESPTKYWERQSREKLQAAVEEGGTEAAAGGFLSGITGGAWDMIPGGGAKPSDLGLFDEPDPLDEFTYNQRTRIVRGAHPGKTLAATIAGSTVGLFYGGAESLAARAGKAVAGTGAKALGFTGRAEKAAAATTRAAEQAAAKDAAYELGLYKNLPQTEAEKIALQAQLAADEARVRGVDIPWEPVEAPVARTAEGAIPMGPGAPRAAQEASEFRWPIRGGGGAQADRAAAAGLGGEGAAVAEAASPVAAGERAAADVVEDALAPASRGGEVATLERPGLSELWEQSVGPSRKGRLKPGQFKSAVDDLKLPDEDARDLVDLLKAERDQQGVEQFFLDIKAGKKVGSGPKAKQMGGNAKQNQAMLRKLEDSIKLRANVVARRAMRGHRTVDSLSPHDIFSTFFHAPETRPALGAASVEVGSAAKAAKSATPEVAAAAPAAREASAVDRGVTALVKRRGEALVKPGARGVEDLARVERGATELVGTEAQIKRKVIDIMHEDLERGFATRTMPDFLRSKSSSWPRAAGYTKAKGEAWLAGEGAPKAPTSRIVEGKWDPGADWSVGRGAPSFPTGEAAAIAPSTRAEDLMRSVATTAIRGGIEGGSYAAGREVSRQGLSGQDFDPVKVAQHAVEGAAVGSLVSLAGAGISSVAGRGAAKLKQAVLSKAGVDTARLDILLARERLVRARLEHLAEDPNKGAYVSTLRALRKEVFNERAKVFEASGRLLKGMSIPLGIGSGIGSGSLVGMLLGHAGAHGAARVLSSGIVKRAGVAVGRAALATGRAAAVPGRPMAKMAGLAIVDSLTTDELEALKVQLDQTDTKDVALAAVKGYRAAGIDPAMTQFLADFQSKRVDLLKLAVDNAGKSSTGRVVASRVNRAVSDPSSITKRLSAGEVYTEDLLVLQNLFPSFYQDMARQSIQLLKRSGLSARQRLDLMKIAGNATYPITTNAIQTALIPQQQEEQPGRRSSSKITNDAATESQRIQGGM